MTMFKLVLGLSAMGFTLYGFYYVMQALSEVDDDPPQTKKGKAGKAGKRRPVKRIAGNLRKQELTKIMQAGDIQQLYDSLQSELRESIEFDTLRLWLEAMMQRAGKFKKISKWTMEQTKFNTTTLSCNLEFEKEVINCKLEEISDGSLVSFHFQPAFQEYPDYKISQMFALFVAPSKDFIQNLYSGDLDACQALTHPDAEITKESMALSAEIMRNNNMHGQLLDIEVYGLPRLVQWHGLPRLMLQLKLIYELASVASAVDWVFKIQDTFEAKIIAFELDVKVIEQWEPTEDMARDLTEDALKHFLHKDIDYYMTELMWNQLLPHMEKAAIYSHFSRIQATVGTTEQPLKESVENAKIEMGKKSQMGWIMLTSEGEWKFSQGTINYSFCWCNGKLIVFEIKPSVMPMTVPYPAMPTARFIERSTKWFKSLCEGKLSTCMSQLQPQDMQSLIKMQELKEIHKRLQGVNASKAVIVPLRGTEKTVTPNQDGTFPIELSLQIQGKLFVLRLTWVLLSMKGYIRAFAVDNVAGLD